MCYGLICENCYSCYYHPSLFCSTIFVCNYRYAGTVLLYPSQIVYRAETNPIADGKNSIQAIVINFSGNFVLAFHSNYPEFPDSCFQRPLTFGINKYTGTVLSLSYPSQTITPT